MRKVDEDRIESAKEELGKCRKRIDTAETLIDMLNAGVRAAYNQKEQLEDFLFLYEPRTEEYTFEYVPEEINDFYPEDSISEGYYLKGVDGSLLENHNWAILFKATGAKQEYEVLGLKNSKEAEDRDGDKVRITFNGDGTIKVEWPWGKELLEEASE